MPRSAAYTSSVACYWPDHVTYPEDIRRRYYLYYYKFVCKYHLTSVKVLPQYQGTPRPRRLVGQATGALTAPATIAAPATHASALGLCAGCEARLSGSSTGQLVSARQQRRAASTTFNVCIMWCTAKPADIPHSRRSAKLPTCTHCTEGHTSTRAAWLNQPVPACVRVRACCALSMSNSFFDPERYRSLLQDA